MDKKKIKRAIIKIPFAVSVYKILRSAYHFPGFLLEYLRFSHQGGAERFGGFSRMLPLLQDKTSTTPFEPHYTYHPAWAARILVERGVEEHVDIASTLQFCAIVSAFMPVKFYDYRPAQLRLNNLTSKHADLTDLDFETDSVSSLSCMHTVEHIGLGRYGDPIDALGDRKAAAELSRVLAPEGTFIFVTPVGKPKAVFNAHRIYSFEQVMDLFPDLKLLEFSLVPDDFKKFGLIRNADPELVKDQEWGCGCFLFTK